MKAHVIGRRTPGSYDFLRAHEIEVEEKIYKYNRLTLKALQSLKTSEEKGGGKKDIQNIQYRYDLLLSTHSTEPYLRTHSCNALTEYGWINLLVKSRRHAFMRKFNSKSTWIPEERDWSMWLREWFASCLPPLKTPPEHRTYSRLEAVLNAHYLQSTESSLEAIHEEDSPTLATETSTQGSDDDINNPEGEATRDEVNTTDNNMINSNSLLQMECIGFHGS